MQKLIEKFNHWYTGQKEEKTSGWRDLFSKDWRKHIRSRNISFIAVYVMFLFIIVISLSLFAVTRSTFISAMIFACMMSVVYIYAFVSIEKFLHKTATSQVKKLGEILGLTWDYMVQNNHQVQYAIKERLVAVARERVDLERGLRPFCGQNADVEAVIRLVSSRGDPKIKLEKMIFDLRAMGLEVNDAGYYLQIASTTVVHDFTKKD